MLISWHDALYDLAIPDRVKLIQLTINRDLQTIINLVNACDNDKLTLDSKRLLLTSHALAQALKNLVDTVRENDNKQLN